jgi:Uncharacterized protein conserved in bacteria
MGKLNVEQDQIFHFPKGIPGFEQETDFAIIEVEEGPFSYLQSLKTDALSFLLTDPFLFLPQYEFELPKAEAEELEISEAVTIRAIVTLRDKLEESTLNLLAPIVLNPVKRLGKQVVLHHSPYSTRHLLLGESPTVEEESSC